MRPNGLLPWSPMKIPQKHLVAAAFVTIFCLVTAPARAEEIPIDIGIGPSYYVIPERIQEKPRPFYGVHLDANAIIGHKTIEGHKGAIPGKYRGAANAVDEARVGYILVPDSLMI